MGFGHQKEPSEIYRGTEHAVSFVPKTKVEVAVPDSLIDRVVDTIAGSAHTGEIGDGKIFVASIDRAMRIRTGEMDLKFKLGQYLRWGCQNRLFLHFCCMRTVIQA
jgi:nitrogen regulatory protein P-II 2